MNSASRRAQPASDSAQYRTAEQCANLSCTAPCHSRVYRMFSVCAINTSLRCILNLDARSAGVSVGLKLSNPPIESVITHSELAAATSLVYPHEATAFPPMYAKSEFEMVAFRLYPLTLHINQQSVRSCAGKRWFWSHHDCIPIKSFKLAVVNLEPLSPL